jgi:hypothetical protein
MVIGRAAGASMLKWSVRLSPWLWSLVAAMPFLSVYGMHFTYSAGWPSGFLGYDQPYYLANGRAIFERGNGITYPNPFDAAETSPAIYFHWLIWLLGFGVVKLGVDPGRLFLAAHLVAAVLCARATWALVSFCANGSRWPAVLYLWTMWGGGVFAFSAMIANLTGTRPALDDLLRHDPSSGWWFLNWGRNLVYPAESVYHALMATVWLAVLRERWPVALCAAASLAATHPFSGLQVLLILTVWCTVSWVLQRLHRVPLWFTVGVVCLFGMFLSYNFIFLRMFEQHRLLMRDWSVKWTLDLPAMWRAYLPVGALAALRIWKDRRQLNRNVWFLLTCWATSLLLANHDWFVRPVQPLHFTRGYVWTPLCLLGLPVLNDSLQWLHRTRQRLLYGLVPAILAAMLALSDNASFVWQYWRNRGEYGVFLTAGEQDIFRQMVERDLCGVLLPPNPRLGYLAAVYTRARPYLGHLFNTPDFYDRQRQMMEWFATDRAGPWFSTVDFVLIRRDATGQHATLHPWRQVAANEEWTLYERTSAAAAD